MLVVPVEVVLEVDGASLEDVAVDVPLRVVEILLALEVVTVPVLVTETDVAVAVVVLVTVVETVV